MKNLVETNKVGIAVNENTEKGFTNAIHELNKQYLDFFKTNTKAAAVRYSWLRQEEKIRQLYSQL